MVPGRCRRVYDPSDSSVLKLVYKVKENSLPLSRYADVQRGVTPFALMENRFTKIADAL
jgi:hypothetical protein